MPDGSFPAEIIEGTPAVAAPEEIDITNAGAPRPALLQAAANGHGEPVADMTRTRFCDPPGLRTLIAAHRRADAGGREVLLVIPSPAVLPVFAPTGMDRVIPTVTTVPEALARTTATANGHRRQRVAGDTALAGDLPDTLKRSSKQARRHSSERSPVPGRYTGKGTRRFAPRTPSSSGRSKNAATTGS
jgi:anti-anti-sigma factor